MAGVTKNQLVLFPLSVQSLQVTAVPPLASLSFTSTYWTLCVLLMLSSNRRACTPLMLERMVSLFPSFSPVSVSAPLTDCSAVAANVSVLPEPERLFVRLWNTVEPESIWSPPSSTTVPEPWLKAALDPMVQDPETVRFPGGAVNVPAESRTFLLISRDPVAV